MIRKVDCEQTLPKGLLGKKTTFETCEISRGDVLLTTSLDSLFNNFYNKYCTDIPESFAFSICSAQGTNYDACLTLLDVAWKAIYSFNVTCCIAFLCAERIGVTLQGVR